jgi:hypothetical protein
LRITGTHGDARDTRPKADTQHLRRYGQVIEFSA